LKGAVKNTSLSTAFPSLSSVSSLTSDVFPNLFSVVTL